jgi:Txe/YoeB family toxin of Txe-Axe toxin-antitoxin module
VTLGRVLEVAKKQQQKAPKRYSRNVTSKQRFVFRVSEGIRARTGATTE